MTQEQIIEAMATLLKQVKISHEMRFRTEDDPKGPQLICRNNCKACERDLLLAEFEECVK